VKRVVLCDVDGVLVDGQTQEHLLFYLFYRYKVSFLIFLQVYFWFLLYKIHCVKDVLNIRRCAFRAFRGWTIQEMEASFLDFFKVVVRPSIRADVVVFLKEKQAKGYEIVFVSASLSGIVKHIRDHLGFGQIIATDLEFNKEICTGMMSGPVDHISDRMLLERATYPLVVHPEPRLRKLAQEKGWKIL